MPSEASWLLGNGKAEKVIDELRRLRAGDPPPCRVAGGMTAEPLPVALQAYTLYARANLNDPATWRSVEALVERLRRLLEGVLGPGLDMLPTSGGSESALTGLFIAREATGRDTVVASSAAHASIAKDARILGMRLIEAPVDYDLRLDVDQLRRILRANSGRVAAVVATLGVTDNGALDPVLEAAEVAWENGAVLYVDAAWGGLPLLGRPAARSTILPRGGPALAGIDFHKHVAPPPSGVLLANTPELLGIVEHRAPYMPSGRQRGLPWTRTAAGLAAAVAALEALGQDGLERLAQHLYGLATRMAEALRTAGVPVHSGPWTPLVAFNVGRKAGSVAEALRRRGWVLYPSRLHGVLRYVAKWCHTPSDVEEIVETVVAAAGRGH
ncbi:aminotransferase class I/II-fold pyridoxal phosphate-dependent enzyme [Pyrodictium abyssi]|uniref:Tyrosine decarboxylase MfnA n=1 Tax=Pyrodictium abyssi TaxID=54256 RepID=A0ABM8IWC9_9CREN|nr:tyrosine decarboxylase MfnA [Pyrodictium abyssi]